MTDFPILVEISIGELFDKISILEIKKSRFSDPGKLENVGTELAILEIAAGKIDQSDELVELRRQLGRVNEELWTIEDQIRICERKCDFGEGFIGLARSVYLINDRRAALKRRINRITGSRLVEEKEFSDPKDGTELS